MRSIAMTALALLLVPGITVYAQETQEPQETAEAETESATAEPPPASETGVRFSPTEDVAADTAVAFPTDI